MATTSTERIVRNRVFQVSSLLVFTFFVTALLFWLLGFGRPVVSVVVALDLSESTYKGKQFNAPDTVKAREIEALKAYLQENSKLKVPNQIQVFGFADTARQLTTSFQSDTQQIEAEIDKELAKSSLTQQIGGGTRIDKALQASTDVLSQVVGSCKDLLLVTDGEFSLSEDIINAIAKAESQKIRINVVIAGKGSQEISKIHQAFSSVGKLHLLGSADDLQTFFTDEFFAKVNSNVKWVAFWLGATWIALMYSLILPLDELCQIMLKLNMTTSGRIVYFNAIFWSVATPLIVLGLFGLPFITECN